MQSIISWPHRGCQTKVIVFTWLDHITYIQQLCTMKLGGTLNNNNKTHRHLYPTYEPHTHTTHEKNYTRASSVFGLCSAYKWKFSRSLWCIAVEWFFVRRCWRKGVRLCLCVLNLIWMHTVHGHRSSSRLLWHDRWRCVREGSRGVRIYKFICHPAHRDQ